MSDLLNSASLVMIPSGYKEDVVYSQIPTDGSGDLSFTRASNGTRINSAGLVEVCPWNFVQQSESIGTSPWLLNGATLTSGQTDPNGGTTAIKVQLASGGNNYVYQGIPLTNPVNIVSAYLRADSATTIGFSIGGSTANAVNLTTSWQLFTFSSTDTSGGIIFDNYFGPSPTQEAKTFYIWHPQLNIGSTAKPYFPTTDRLNVPRLTYQNGGGGCPSLLLEKQSTNLITYSEQFDNAAWSKSNVTITANNTTSPDGTQNADLSTATAGGELLQGVVLSISTSYTFSFYVKKGTASDAKYRVYNFDAGVNVVAPTSYISQTSTSDWVRVVVSFTTGATGTNYGIYLLDQTSAGTMYFWGAQLEASSYGTSYIPSTSATATRVADTCFKTGISSLIGQTEGVLFAEFDMISNANSGAYQTIINIATDANNSIDILKNNTTSELYVFAINGGVIQVNSVGISGTNILGRHKIALAYKSNDYVCYLDGVQVFTDTSASVPACSNLYLGAYLGASNILAGSISQAVLFKTRLTNAELASLTTI